MKQKVIKTKPKIQLSQEYVELFVKGIVVGPGYLRPVLLLRDKTEQETLPVWLNPLEFESLDVQSSPALKSSYFHIITRKIMKEMGYRMDRCVFTDLVGHHQYVNIFLVKEAAEDGLWVQSSAEEAMSLCLAMGTRYFATPDVIEKSRSINSELVASFVELPQHPYIM
jgi:hypothetical protein